MRPPKRQPLAELLEELDALEPELPSALAFGEPVRSKERKEDKAPPGRAPQSPRRVRSKFKARSD